MIKRVTLSSFQQVACTMDQRGNQVEGTEGQEVTLSCSTTGNQIRILRWNIQFAIVYTYHEHL